MDKKLETSYEKAMRAARGLRASPGYYSVIIPYSERPTAWHPTEKRGDFSTLTRGAFKTAFEAHQWAKTNLRGQPYKIRRFEGTLGIAKKKASMVAVGGGLLSNPKTMTFVEYLEKTLIPDLKDSGSKYTAEDFKKCAKAIRAGRKSAKLAAYMRMVGRDYKESGRTSTAQDYETCAKLVDPKRRAHGIETESLQAPVTSGRKPTKWVTVYILQGNYGTGWDDLTASDNWREARAERKTYDQNEPSPHRVISRRVLREKYEKGDY